MKSRTIAENTDIRSWQKSWLLRFRIAENCYKNRNLAKGLILDVGCGTKRYKELLKPYSRYIGIDLLPKIKRRKHRERKRATDVYGDALCIPLKDSSVDTIAAFEVLEHLKNPFKAFSEFARVIKRNGYLFLSTPQMYNLHEEPYDFFRYTPYGLRELAEKSGFEVTKIVGIGGFKTRLAMKFMYWKPGMALTFLNPIINKFVYLTDREAKQDICNNFLIARKK